MRGADVDDRQVDVFKFPVSAFPEIKLLAKESLSQTKHKCLFYPLFSIIRTSLSQPFPCIPCACESKQTLENEHALNHVSPSGISKFILRKIIDQTHVLFTDSFVLLF